MATEYTLSGLEDRLQEYSQAFDSLLSLIPSKYYISEDSQENTKYQHNKNKRAPRQEIKERTKKAKKAKLDPENHKSVVEIQAEKAQDADKEEEDSDSEADLDEDAMSVDEDSKIEVVSPKVESSGEETEEIVKPLPSSSIEDLKARLQSRIAELRANRKVPSSNSETRDGILESRKKRKSEKKEKRKQEQKKMKLSAEEVIVETDSNKNAPKNASASTVNMDGDISFSKFEFDGPKKKKGSLPAAVALKKVEAKQEKLEKLKATDKEKAEKIIENEQWKKALQMSAGAKLKDDPKLLKKTIKRDEVKKKKSSKEWNERKTQVTESIANKQKKRNENIKARIDAKKNKGKGKSAKKSRPGFEGKKKKH
ncbi:SURF6-domain-containing protein [Basidiobolus meristosporus CBS 931.73]|uniref:SURF6-domain-containing protein n=1 Tax=Basidiobolus meristosporus CBS 931.73 TaxID=1314790 RepID=A0A1Y1Z2W7_9FUNG|nr:SURF6-domain-containing protein [Basidiobolus meristosporus CBS 931.73]|eukprot:ORY04185.1 SURF6-domain-containing protein [Basidiobolus meristosporus CBS 931.73]